MPRRFLLTIKAQSARREVLAPKDATTDDISRIMFRAMIQNIRWDWKELLLPAMKGLDEPATPLATGLRPSAR